MSSPAPSDTRARILEAAVKLMSAHVADASLGRIAQEAGVSRQAVYLHFKDRADLYLALVRYVDETRNLAPAIRAIEEAPDGEAALAAAVESQIKMNPAVYPIASAMDAVRRQDPEIDRAWQDRLADRRRGARAIAGRLEAEGRLRAGLDVETAADLIWSMLSLRVWEDLVIGRRWSARRYREHIGEALRRALLKQRPGAAKP
ncbi:MAG: TetR family transcriptional regulator [Hyphomonadaceae bacterium]|nr:TetR family transcriptional regulator [Hyphomonadaceae bacterium]